MQPIYLDHNATTPIDPVVVSAMTDCYQAGPANPASPHASGRIAQQRIEESRQEIARILGAEIGSRTADVVVFTSGGTESNNLCSRGLAGETPGRLIVSAIEHSSTLATAQSMQRRGWQVNMLRVGQSGQIDLDHLADLLRETGRSPCVVSIMLANHETGVLQPIQEAARLCRDAGVRIHSDAVQAAGKIPVDFRRLDVDAVTIAAHKFHGPAGIGAVLLRNDIRLQPILFGGPQQMGVRPGTEPVALAVGMQVALQRWEREASERAQRMRSGRDALERRLGEQNLEVVVNGQEPRLPHTSNLSFLGLDRQALWMALDLAGIQCSTGSACASGASDLSPVLQAMDLGSARTESALRFGLGATTTAADIEQAAGRILSTIQYLRQRNSAAKSASSGRERRPKAI